MLIIFNTAQHMLYGFYIIEHLNNISTLLLKIYNKIKIYCKPI